MKICFVLLKKWAIGNVFLFFVGIIVVLVINFLIGVGVRELYYKLIANEDPPQIKNSFKFIITQIVWGILGSIFLMYIFNLWGNLGPR